MSDITKFSEEILSGYTLEGDYIVAGGAMLEGECLKDHFVKIPLRTLNRHGLIAGATGTGKTKSLQVIAEQLSNHGIPSMLMDIKGDLSGIAAASPGHKKIDERHEAIGLPFEAGVSPVEFLSLSDEKGVRLRATVSEFGPILLSKILDLTDVQSGILSVLFKYCDDNRLPLLDLNDLKKILQYATDDAGKDEIEKEYGKISSTSVSTILRKIVELESQGAERFFGETSFDVEDLLRTNDEGKGVVSILRLTDIQGKPKLFSTFMLQLLAEIYATMPEAGDLPKPKLALFIDEAHLVFNEASDALLDQIETIIKLIRSKGVGIFFITQNPTDIPDSVLSQLGLKVQHALRAFTAKDRKAIKTASENFPISDYYETDELLTTMGIGEAMVTCLNEDGIPTPLAHTLMRAPQSRMDILTNAEIDSIIKASDLISKYNKVVDRESAYEILNEKIEEYNTMLAEQEAEEERQKAEKKASSSRSRSRKEEGFLESKAARTIGKEIGNVAVRGLLGVFGVKTRRRKFF